MLRNGVINRKVYSRSVFSERRKRMDINNLVLRGRLTREANVSVSANGIKVARASLCTNTGKRGEDGKHTPVFVSFSAFGREADVLESCSKGALLNIRAHVFDNSYERREGGGKVYTVSIIADEVDAVMPKPQAAPQAQAPVQGGYVQGQIPPQQFTQVPQGGYAQAPQQAMQQAVPAQVPPQQFAQAPVPQQAPAPAPSQPQAPMPAPMPAQQATQQAQVPAAQPQQDQQQAGGFIPIPPDIMNGLPFH